MVCVVVPALVFTSQVQAQKKPRGQFFEGLIRNFIDSQGPALPPPRVNVPRPSRQVNMTQVRAELEHIDEESYELARVLSADVHRLPQARALAADAMKLHAAAHALETTAGRITRDARPVVDGFRNLDQQWRVFSHAAQRVPHLNNASRKLIAEIDSHNVTLGKLLGVEPQLDRNEISRQLYSYQAEVRHLSDDIRSEVRDRRASALLLEADRLRQSLTYLENNVRRNVPASTIVSEYQKIDAAWQRFAGQLRTLNDRHIERGVQRIFDIDREMHKLLWLELDTNYNELTQLCVLLQREMSAVLDSITLRQVVETPGGRELLTACDEFNTSCGDFRGCVETEEDDATLRLVYGYVGDDWAAAERRLATLPADARRQIHLQQVQSTLGSIQQLIGASASQSTGQNAQQLAAAIDYDSQRLVNELNRRFATPGYDTTYRRDMLQAATRFQQYCGGLHRDAISGVAASQLSADCRQMAKQWSQMRRLYAKLQPADRTRLDPLRSRITGQLVELEARLVERP